MSEYSLFVVRSAFADSGEYKGFDWFAGFVFILLRGNSDKVFSILRMLAAHFSSPFLWPRRFHNSVHSINCAGVLGCTLYITFVFKCTVHVQYIN